MLELAILGLLIESPMHGYELRKRLTHAIVALLVGLMVLAFYNDLTRIFH